MSRRPTRTDLADHYRREWLQEREDAQAVPCPDCRAAAGTPCHNPITGRPLDRAPAHPARIRDRARTARTGSTAPTAGTGGYSRPSTAAATSRRSSPTPPRAA